jgi:hypothetical protein
MSPLFQSGEVAYKKVKLNAMPENLAEDGHSSDKCEASEL